MQVRYSATPTKPGGFFLIPDGVGAERLLAPGNAIKVSRTAPDGSTYIDTYTIVSVSIEVVPYGGGQEGFDAVFLACSD